jgi:Fe-S cluster biogenesis protein NfuA
VQEVKSRVVRVIDRMRPTLKSDGGNIELVSVDEGKGLVRVKVQGRYANTPYALEILRSGVEEAIKKEVPQIREVLTVSS